MANGNPNDVVRPYVVLNASSANSDAQFYWMEIDYRVPAPPATLLTRLQRV